MFLSRSASRRSVVRAFPALAAYASTADAQGILAAARERRAELAPIDRDGGVSAIASATNLKEVYERVREVRTLSAQAAATAFGREAAARDERARAMKSVPALAPFDDDVRDKVIKALEFNVNEYSVHTLARLVHDSDRMRFEASPVSAFVDAATRRIEREGDQFLAMDLCMLIWGVANWYKRRKAQDAQTRESLSAFLNASSGAIQRLFETWSAQGNKTWGKTVCTTLKNLLIIAKVAHEGKYREGVPKGVVDALVRAAARNADAMTPQQTSYLLHDVLEANAHDSLTPEVMRALTSSMKFDDLSTPLSALAALSWSYSKLDALDVGLVSLEHVASLHEAMFERIVNAQVRASRDIAMALYSVARLGSSHPGFGDVTFRHVACTLLLLDIAEMPPRAVCMIAWSLNRMRPSDDESFIHSQFLEALGNAVRHSLATPSAEKFSCKELATTIHALVALRYTNPKLLELARLNFLRDVDAYAQVPQSLTIMLWSFATMEIDLGDDGLRSTMRAFVANAAAKTTDYETRTILQSLARLRLKFDDDEPGVDDISRTINDTIEKHLHEYSNEDCEVIAWSLLSLRLRATEKLLERVGVEFVANDIGVEEYVVQKPVL